MYYIYVVTIKVPWGHIAGKAWGSSNGRPVLALHGKYIFTLTYITGFAIKALL